LYIISKFAIKQIIPLISGNRNRNEFSICTEVKRINNSIKFSGENQGKNSDMVRKIEPINPINDTVNFFSISINDQFDQSIFLNNYKNSKRILLK
jgi:hypothetical protein